MLFNTHLNNSYIIVMLILKSLYTPVAFYFILTMWKNSNFTSQEKYITYYSDIHNSWESNECKCGRFIICIHTRNKWNTFIHDVYKAGHVSAYMHACTQYIHIIEHAIAYIHVSVRQRSMKWRQWTNVKYHCDDSWHAWPTLAYTTCTAYVCMYVYR